MIVVANTVELEKRYNLDKIKDNEQVIVKGGLSNKEKYNKKMFKTRTTYTGRQIKQLIGQMEQIENTIPKEWNEYQRAKYIYEILGNNIDYNHNKEEYKTQQFSNLTGLLSRKSICAGYSLIYKEMMDRQGIQCDYIRGNAGINNELHAWNVLTINGESFPVDLTWDSNLIRNGEKQLRYFGVDKNFHESHKADKDENRYRYVTYEEDFVNSIDTDCSKEGLSQEERENIIQLAIEETYLKFKQKGNIDIAKSQVENSIKEYIRNGDASGFTRQGNARDQLIENITSQDMINIMSKNYVKQSLENNTNILDKSVIETLIQYDEQHTSDALAEYINTGKSDGFTRNNNARKNLQDFVTSEGAMNLMVNKVVQEHVETIEDSCIVGNNIILEAESMYFSANEFEQISLPEEKRKGIIGKAVQWIKEKTMEKKEKSNIKNKDNKIQENENYR